MQRLRTAFLTTTEGLPREYWALWGANMLDWLGKFVAFFLTLYLADERGLSGSQVALVIALNGLANVPSSFLGGVLADRFGRRQLIVGGYWLIALGLASLGIARGVEQLAAAALFLGFVSGLPRASMSAMIADVVPPEHRKRAYSLNHWAINVGAMVALPLAGLLADLSFSLLFIGDALTSFAAGLLVFLVIPRTIQHPAPKPATEQRHGLGRLRLAIFSDRRALQVVLLVFLFACVYHQTRLALPLDMRDHGIPKSAFGALIGLNGFLIVALQLPVSRFINKYSSPLVMAAGSICLGVAYGICAFVTDDYALPLYVVSITVLSIGEILFFPTAVAFMAERAPVEKRAQYQGAFLTAWGPLAHMGGSVGGIILDDFGGPVLWIGCFILGNVVAVGWWLLGEKLRPVVVAPQLVETPA